MTTYLHIDIETLPALHMSIEQRLAYAYASVPKTYKKPESIAKWVRENTEEQWRRTSLDPLHGITWMVGVAANDEDPSVFVGNPEDPAGLLDVFDAYCAGVYDRSDSVVWVGKSLRRFDLPWLAQHALLYGRCSLARTLLDLLAYPYDKRIEDVSELWPGGRLSLDPMARWLGVDGKAEGMHGSQVYDAYLRGEVERVACYCAGDVDSTRNVWKRLTGRMGGAGRRPELSPIPLEVRQHLTD